MTNEIPWQNTSSWISKPSFSLVLKNDFHVTAADFKRRKTGEEKKSERLIEYTPKKKTHNKIQTQGVIDIWRNMTVLDLSKSLGKDLGKNFFIQIRRLH